MRQATWLIAAAALLAACSADPYPLPAGSPSAAGQPVVVGKSGREVVLTLTVRPGDRIELLSAEPVGVGDAATVSFLLSRPVFHPNGDSVIGEEVETLNGAQLASVSASPGPANEVGIVAEATAVRPGRYELTSVRLRYRRNGGAEQVGDGIDVTWTICVDGPAPTTCSG